jgi:hypothetical protein
MVESLKISKIRKLSDTQGNEILMSNGLRDSSVLNCSDGTLYRMERVLHLNETQEAMIAVRDALGKNKNIFSDIYAVWTDSERYGRIGKRTQEPPLVRLCAEAKKQQSR